jgi:FKBP-type peptidyl-prolyl cis-trans isomerase
MGNTISAAHSRGTNQQKLKKSYTCAAFQTHCGPIATDPMTNRVSPGALVALLFVSLILAACGGSTSEPLNPEQAEEAMANARTEALTQFTEEIAALPTAMERGRAFLAANEKRSGVKQTSSGLQYEVVSAGNGPRPTADQTVRVNYEGRLIDGTVFDSSFERGESITFPLRAVISGWTEGLQLMPVGSRYMLYIPSELAYGSQGARGAFGPDETLIFLVELIGIEAAE